jgi:Ala-tRNA(Pro) deacylase
MHVEDFLTSRGVRFEKHTHATTFTSQALAQAERVSGYEVAKPVIVKGATGFTMCVLPAPAKLDLKRVGEALHDSQVRLASEDEMAGLFPDCELGAEPPIGPLFGMKTVSDPALNYDEYLVMQAGTHNQSIRLRRADWQKVCQPTVAPIALV